MHPAIVKASGRFQRILGLVVAEQRYRGYVRRWKAAEK
jgi:hypothetical protein